MRQKSVRNSNIEWLRIISMLLIIAYHATRMGYNRKGIPFAVYAGGQLLGSWGILGVDLFLIIGAWFLCDQSFRVKKLIAIVFQTFTWVLVFTVLAFVHDLRTLGSFAAAGTQFITDLTYTIFQQPLWAECYWFITAYCFMLLLSPLLNKLLDSVPQTRMKNILLLLLVVPLYSQFYQSAVGDVVYFSYVYLLVGYWKRYGWGFLEKTAKPPVILALTLVILAARLVCYIPATTTAISLLQVVLQSSLASVNRHSMVMLADALLIFFFVIRLKPRHSKLVNAIAECTLGVYLFHENDVLGFPNVVETVFEQLTERGFIGKTALFPLQYLAAVVLVFLVGTLLEFIRQQAIQKPFMNRITARRGDKLASIDDWFSRL